MPNYTTNYNLTKPLSSELYDINVQNENMDKIDETLGDIDKKVPTPTTSDTGKTLVVDSNGQYALGEGGGSDITVDSALSSTSTNPVQNKVINTALAGKAASSHNQAASTITAGTLGGKVQANASAMATITNPQVRDIVGTTTDPGAGTASSYPNGTVVLVYE